MPVAVKVRGALTPPVVGPAIVTERVSALIVIMAEAVAVFAFASVIVSDTV